MKRKELEVPRLKLLTDKKDRRAEAVGTLRPAEARRVAWRFGKAEVKKDEDVEKLHAALQRLKKQNKELTADNFELKRVQDQMKRDIQQLLGKRRGDGLNETKEDLNQTHDITSEQLTHSICEQWHSLKKHLQRLESQVATQPIRGENGNHVIRVTDHEKEIVMLKQEIAASRRLIVMQQQVMQEQLQTAQNSRPPSQLKGYYFLEEQRRLQEDRGMLEQQKRTLQMERWNFTEAAIRLGYEAIHGFRETEKLRWTKESSQILQRVRNAAFPPGVPQLSLVHVLDLEKSGYIKPHIDSVKFCGSTIAGLCLLSSSVMRLVSEENQEDWADLLLERRCLYILRGTARYKFTHQILRDEDSFFNGQKVSRDRRISVICRNLPDSTDSAQGLLPGLKWSEN
uniref:Afadin- and alpha-actinin-binding protein-like isoform X2 n=1 Tax=Geotrypetes seraphini TaxID=260995 RepID=A0A6P8PF24_GEOSA|nr:afadin- and alpha-actinin-binding protein-like isoform X2 [Geotrypetes seraphini]